MCIETISPTVQLRTRSYLWQVLSATTHDQSSGVTRDGDELTIGSDWTSGRSNGDSARDYDQCINE